jgi:polyhydroxybutyrate depolymerase
MMKTSLLPALLCAFTLTASAQNANDARARLLQKSGDGKVDDAERARIRAMLQKRRQQPGAMTPSGRTDVVGNRQVTEMQYLSSDRRKISCVLSMPRGDGPFPIVVTIHGGQGDRDFQYLRTMAAPNPVSPTITALNEQPWAVLAISYRSGDGALFGMENEDVYAGIRFAKTLPKIDAARVAVIGGSHGGHLALRAAETMGREFLCVAAGSPWMTDPFAYMAGDPAKPPLSLVPEKARAGLMENGQRLMGGLTRRMGSEAKAKDVMREQSIEANAGKIIVPTLVITSLADEQAPHVMVLPTIESLKKASRDVTTYTAEKSPHGFYWGREVGGARIGRGEKTPEEKAEELKARETIIAFLTKQFARTDVKVVESPKVVAAPPVSERPAEAATTKPKLESTTPPSSPAPRSAGTTNGEPITREQFKQRFANNQALAGRPEVLDRLFDRLDENKDGKVDAEEMKKLSTLRGQRGGGAPGASSEATKPTATLETKPKPTSTTKPDAPPASNTPGSREPYVKKTLTQEQSGAIRKMRERMANLPVPENLTRRTLTIGGKEREFFINIPAKCKGKPSPVIFALHGGASSTGLAEHLKVDFTKLGETEGYVTVYPSGINGWNIGSHDSYSVKRRTSDADDVGFFRAMFDTLIKEGTADKKRLYVTGGSNGGVMTQFLVCQLADRIAGAGVVVATLPRAAEKDWPKPSRPVPIFIMLGTVDPMKPWNGNRDQMSADETIAFWRKQNTSTGDVKKWDLPDRDPNDGCRVHAQRWEGKAPVVFYTLEGHGHGWPMQKGRDKTGTGPKTRDKTGTGPKTRDISAPEEFWKFFQSTSPQPTAKP